MELSELGYDISLENYRLENGFDHLLVGRVIESTLVERRRKDKELGKMIKQHVKGKNKY